MQYYFLNTQRKAIAMIELIFAIVIMGIVLLGIPNLVNVSTSSGFTSLQQEAIATASSQINLIMTKNWDEDLVERYGLIEHKNLNSAIKQALRWLEVHTKSPMLLLSLARMSRDNQQLSDSKQYYITSLNFSASAEVYLELAELLESLVEHDNADICYKQGLKYSINHEGEILNLQ